MSAYEMLLSESQERMLMVAHAGREREVVDIFRKWDLDAVVIGRVRDSERMQVLHEGQKVADIPVSALTDEAPRYDRPMKPFGNVVAGNVDILSAEASEVLAKDSSGAFRDESSVRSGAPIANKMSVFPASALPAVPAVEALLKLIGSPNIASKQWVYRQYDHMVRTNTAVLPGADAAVVRIKETRRALAMTLDGNGRYCAANPREGAKLVVAEAARNVACVGARPLAITNCLNFASPERPEVMWSFSEVVDGMAEACRAFNTPIVSGNVSFYNETEGHGILPTPVIGMVGLIEDVRRVIQPGFKHEEDLIALLGTTADDLSISEYMALVEGLSTEEMAASGRVPRIDLDRERAVQNVCLEAADAGLLQSAHDCSDGGLAVALAESCFSSLNRTAIGADVEIIGPLSTATLLFGESPSRIIISFAESARIALEEIARRGNCPFTVLGRVGGNRLSINTSEEPGIDLSVEEVEAIWRNSLARKLEAETLVAGRE